MFPALLNKYNIWMNNICYINAIKLIIIEYLKFYEFFFPLLSFWKNILKTLSKKIKAKKYNFFIKSYLINILKPIRYY